LQRAEKRRLSYERLSCALGELMYKAKNNLFYDHNYADFVLKSHAMHREHEIKEEKKALMRKIATQDAFDEELKLFVQVDNTLQSAVHLCSHKWTQEDEDEFKANL
jgi:hypothetical protein